MDTTEAKTVLENHVGSLRKQPYSELKRLSEERVIHSPELKGDSGKSYYLEVQFLWDSTPHGNVRVIVSIDDGHRASRPLDPRFH